MGLLSLLGGCSCRGSESRGAQRCPRSPIRSWRGSGVDVAASVLAASHFYFFVLRTWSVDCYRVESVLYREMASYCFSCWRDASYSPSVLKSYLVFSQCSVCLPVTEAIPDKLSPHCKRAYQEKKNSPRELMLVAETGLTCAVYLEGWCIFNVVSVTKEPVGDVNIKLLLDYLVLLTEKSQILYIVLTTRGSFIAGRSHVSLVSLVADVPRCLAANSGCPWMTVLCFSDPARTERRLSTSLHHQDERTSQPCAFLRPSCGCCSGSTP